MVDKLLSNLEEIGKKLNSYLNITQEQIDSAIKECRRIQVGDNYCLKEMQAILSWQTDINVHPLTCENCQSCLLPSIEDGVVVLKCPTCNYVQENIPTHVFCKYFDEKSDWEEIADWGCNAAKEAGFTEKDSRALLKKIRDSQNNL